MAFNAGSVKGYAILDSSGWETGANKIDKSNVGITKSIMTAQVALGAIKLAFSAVTSVLKDSINAYIESEKVQSQLNAVLTSTKYAAGMTAKEINNMAASLQSVTTYDDEAIVSGQNLLLTFTKIGKDVFPLATETMLDMSTALGQDLKSSATQLGKALQDPVLGITALRRVGVNFTDAQKDMIEGMVRAGKTMEAQKFILKELQTEFGGSAKAARDTLGGSILALKNEFGNLQEYVGGLFASKMEGTIKRLTTLIEDMNKSLSAATIESEGNKIRIEFANIYKHLQVLNKNNMLDAGKELLIPFIAKLSESQLAVYKDYLDQLETISGTSLNKEVKFNKVLQDKYKARLSNFTNYVNSFNDLAFLQKEGLNSLYNIMKNYQDKTGKLKDLKPEDMEKILIGMSVDDLKKLNSEVQKYGFKENVTTIINSADMQESNKELKLYNMLLEAYNNALKKINITKKKGTIPTGDIEPETEVDWSKYREEYIAWQNELIIKNAVVTKDLRTQTIAFTNLGEAIHVTGLAFQSLSDIGSEFYDLGFDFTGTFDLIQDSINDLIDSIKGFKDGINGMDKIAVAVLNSVAATLQTAANIIASVQQRLSASSQAEIDTIKSTYDEKRKIVADNTATEIKTTEGVTQAELDALRDKFDQGIIGYQEYAIHAEELKRNQASKEKIIEKKKSDELLKIDEEEKEALYQANLKQFYTDQGFAIANVWIQAGVGIVSAFAQSIAQLGPIVGAILGGILGTAITGMAVAQTALIATQKPPSRAMGGFASGTTKVNEYGGGEIITLPDGSQVIPNDISKQIANNISNSEDRGMVNNFYFNDTKIMNEDGMQVIANFVIREIGRQARFR